MSSGPKRLKDGARDDGKRREVGILGVPKGNFNPSWNITAPYSAFRMYQPTRAVTESAWKRAGNKKFLC